MLLQTSYHPQKNQCHLPILSSYRHCSILLAKATRLHSSTPSIQPPCLLSGLLYSTPWYRHGGSCTTNVRNSVNFTLCCLPKNPGSRFGDLTAQVSFQSSPRPPPAEDPVPAASLFGCGSQKTSWSHQLWGHFKQAGTSSDLWHRAICIVFRKKRKERKISKSNLWKYSSLRNL